MPYIVKCWIATDQEDPEVHKTLRDAQAEYDHNILLQPENHYEVVEVDGDGEEV